MLKFAIKPAIDTKMNKSSTSQLLASYQGIIKSRNQAVLMHGDHNQMRSHQLNHNFSQLHAASAKLLCPVIRVPLVCKIRHPLLLQQHDIKHDVIIDY